MSWWGVVDGRPAGAPVPRGPPDADVEKALCPFAADAIVESPLYGTMSAAEFCPALFADTAESALTLRATTVGGTTE